MFPEVVLRNGRRKSFDEYARRGHCLDYVNKNNALDFAVMQVQVYDILACNTKLASICEYMNIKTSTKSCPHYSTNHEKVRARLRWAVPAHTYPRRVS
jgi:hypothetical protein